MPERQKIGVRPASKAIGGCSRSRRRATSTGAGQRARSTDDVIPRHGESVPAGSAADSLETMRSLQDIVQGYESRTEELVTETVDREGPTEVVRVVDELV